MSQDTHMPSGTAWVGVTVPLATSVFANAHLGGAAGGSIGSWGPATAWETQVGPGHLPLVGRVPAVVGFRGGFPAEGRCPLLSLFAFQQNAHQF